MHSPIEDRTLNRTILRRQLLLHREVIDVPAALERVGGLQTQYAPTAYVGLWSRVDAFDRRSLTLELERRRVVQATLMRATIHIVSAGDFFPLAAGVRSSRRLWWQRTAAARGLGDVDMEAVAVVIDRALEREPLRRKALIETLHEAGYPKDVFGGVGLWLDLVRIPPSGTWERRRADVFQTADRWLGPTDTDEAAGLELLVRRYLGGFGPASRGSIASWTGVPARILDPTLDSMDLVEFKSEDGTPLCDIPGGPIEPAESAAPVRFLGPWEAILLVHARRSQVLPEEHRPRVFSTKNPHSVGTFLVDGSVRGAWKLDGERVTIDEFEPLQKSSRAEVMTEAERLEEFISG